MFHRLKLPQQSHVKRRRGCELSTFEFFAPGLQNQQIREQLQRESVIFGIPDRMICGDRVRESIPAQAVRTKTAGERIQGIPNIAQRRP